MTSAKELERLYKETFIDTGTIFQNDDTEYKVLYVPTFSIDVDAFVLRSVIMSRIVNGQYITAWKIASAYDNTIKLDRFFLSDKYLKISNDAIIKFRTWLES